MSDDDARKKVTEDFKQFATGAIDADLWEWFVRRISYISGDFDDPATVRQAERSVGQGRSGAQLARQLFLLPRHRAEFFGDIVERLAKVGLMTEENGHWRRVIIEKPFGHDLDSAKALNQQLLKVADRTPDLPHRSLPGKRNRPEHFGAAIRQRNFRAHLESPLHRPRADFSRRNRRRRTARRLLRWSRRAARHGAQPHHATHHAHRHGTADFLRGERGPRRASQNSARHPALQQ